MVPECLCSKSVYVCVCASHSPEMVYAYTEALHVSSQCVSLCVNENKTERSAAPLRRSAALNQNPLQGLKKKRLILF